MKFYLINCNAIRATKDNGDIGINNPLLFNQEFGDKMLWYAMSEVETW